MSHAEFGIELRRWRRMRGWSQAKLAFDAEISARHLSCLETGKSKASREMVLVLGSALDLPLRERNALLHAAGFAPAYSGNPLSSMEMDQVRRALELILAQQNPYPAFVFDRDWNVQQMNDGGRLLLQALRVDPAAVGPAIGNGMHLLFHPAGLRHSVVNWNEVASVTLERLKRDARLGDQATVQLLGKLEEYPGVADLPSAHRFTEPSIFLPIHIRRDDVELKLFTTLTSLGTARDVTAEELKIESYFPADEDTEHWFAQRATHVVSLPS